MEEVGNDGVITVEEGQSIGIEKEVVKGVVVGITDREVILNIGFKSDGIVSSNEP